MEESILLGDNDKKSALDGTGIDALQRFFLTINQKDSRSADKLSERPKIKDQLLAMLSEGDEQEKACLALIRRAQRGDVKAFETIRDMIGERPDDSAGDLEAVTISDDL